jgi:hypothetical protein
MDIEEFPSTSYLENLSGLTDALTGVYYPAKGEGLDWYVSFVKCIYRLIKNVSVVSGLRVCRNGDREFYVNPGMYFDGNTLRPYQNNIAGTLSDNATNYVYLTLDGVVRVSATAFPDPAVTRHIRLATIRLANGSYSDDDIVDYRQAHLWQAAGPISNIAAAAIGLSHLSDSVAAMLPKLAFSVSGENANMNTVTIQVQNARGEALAGRFLIQGWLSDAAYAGETPTAPAIAATWTAGQLIEETTAKKRWLVLTDSTGRAVLSITEPGTHVWYLNAEVNSGVSASAGISFS